MGRSPGFGSTACDYNPLRGHALFRLAFAAAPGVTPLTSPHTVTRRLILQKARHQPAFEEPKLQEDLRPLTVCRSTVSGSISLPSRGTFHLSLTVLFTIGHQACLALRCGQRGFTLDFACPGLLGMTLRRPVDFRLQGYYLLWLGFPTDSASRRFCNSSPARQSQHERSHNPVSATAAALTRTRFRLLPVRSPLLREYLFLRVLRCFSSPGALYLAYVFSQECLGISPGRFPHSEIPGSSLASSFPRHFAGSHVLLRRLVPRHPPWTLTSLSAYVHSSTAEDGSRSRIQIRLLASSERTT